MAARAAPPGKPRVVFAVPAYNEETFLAETIESLLGQTDERLRVVVLDNASTDDTGEIAQRLAREDDRLTVERNERMLGAVDNWRRAFRRARELHPEAEYFAWAAAHDRLDPRWLERLASTLDAHPRLIGAFAAGFEFDARGERGRPVKRRGGTVGLGSARARMAKQLPGTTVQGLFRPAYLERVGISRRVLLPDRLLMAELAAQGELEEVYERLWLRRATTSRSLSPPELRRRQRATLFTGGPPLHSRLPWPLVHAAALVWALVVRGNGVIGRGEGLELTMSYLRLSMLNVWRNPRDGWLTPLHKRWTKPLLKRRRAASRRTRRAARKLRKRVRRTARRALARAGASG